MKKLLIVIAVGLLFGSCSKSEDFTCECTHTYLTGGGTPPTTNVINAKDRGEAARECSSYANVDSGNITHACSLK